MEPEENLIKQRLKKLEEIKKLGIEPYPYRFKRTKTIAKIKEMYKEIKKDLHLMNINAATLFPGLDGFTQSLYSQFDLFDD